MTPVCRCLRKVDEAAATADSAMTDRIRQALSELEAAYARPSECIVALEAVLHEFERSPQAGNAALSRVLRIAVDRRQGFWARRSGTRRGTANGAATAARRRGAEPSQASPV